MTIGLSGGKKIEGKQLDEVQFEWGFCASYE